MTAFASTRTITGNDTPTTADDSGMIIVNGTATITLNATGWTAGESAVGFLILSGTATFTGSGATVSNASSDLVQATALTYVVAHYRASGQWVVSGTETPYITGGTDVAIADGGTGASTAAGARDNLQVAGPVFTPEQYGSAGNGSTDDSAAVQDAIDAADAAEGQGKVVITQRHRLSTGLIAYGDNRVVIEFAGGVLLPDANICAIELRQMGLPNPGVALLHPHIDGQDNVGTTGIRIHNSGNHHIVHPWVKDCRTSIQFLNDDTYTFPNSEYCEHSLILHPFLDGGGHADSVGIDFLTQNGGNVSFAENHIEGPAVIRNCGDAGVRLGAGGAWTRCKIVALVFPLNDSIGVDIAGEPANADLFFSFESQPAGQGDPTAEGRTGIRIRSTCVNPQNARWLTSFTGVGSAGGGWDAANGNFRIVNDTNVAPAIQWGGALFESTSTVDATGASYAIAPTATQTHDLTLTAATVTLSLGSTIITNGSNTARLVLRQDGTGSRTVTWPGAVDWGDDGAPTLSTTANAVDIIDVFTVDGGTKWHGRHVWSDDTSLSGSGMSNLVDDTTPQLGGDLDLNGNVITGMEIGTDVAAPAETWTWRAVDTKTAAYTLVIADAGKLIEMDADADITIPDNASVAFPVGTQVGLLLAEGHSGNVVDAAGVTLNGETAGSGSLAMTAHQIVVCTKLATDRWNVSGV